MLRDRELLEEAWQELRHEKEKVNRAALRIQNREEEIKSTTKASGASALQFTAVRGPATKLGFPIPPKVVNPNPVLGGG